MRRTADHAERRRAYQTFEAHLRVTGDYRAAARKAGVSERTGRRWLARAATTDVSKLSKTNLSPCFGRFVGRQSELANLRSLLGLGAASDARERLVTLLGPPGIGKTRLAREVGLACLHDAGSLTGGVWFCDLAEARDATGVCVRVARSISAPLVPENDADDDVALVGRAINALGPCLIILDNFEQLVPCAPSTVGRWLELAPDAALLVTSRERLRVAAELTVELGPLSVPSRGADPGSSEAVTLFMDRAQRIGASSAVRLDEISDVAKIVERLDGIPLAIELAVARLDVLRPAALLARLENGFEVLSHGPRDASTRQATLRNAVEWSWTLLGPLERAAFAQCSIFRGGFSLDAAEAVLDLDAYPDRPSVMEVLHLLRSKSLLRADGALGEARFGMFEIVHEFAAERLEDSHHIEDRHTAYFLRLGATLAREVEHLDGALQFERLVLEQDNLLSVVHRSLAVEPPTASSVENALLALLALDPVLSTRGPFSLYVSLLDLVIDKADPLHVDRRLRVRALRARGEAKRTMGRLRESAQDAKSALAESMTTADQLLQGESLHDMAVLARQQGSHETGAYYEAALERLSQVAEPHVLARVLDDFAVYCRQRGDTEKALQLHEQALELVRQHGAGRLLGIILGNIGTLHHQVGLLEAARSYYERALVLVRAAGDRRHEGLFVGRIGMLAQESGQWQEAQAHYQHALAGYRSVGDRRFEGVFLSHQGSLLREQGRYDDAIHICEQARQLLHDAGDRRTEGLVVAALGGIYATLGRSNEANRLFDAAANTLRASWDPSPSVALALERIHLHLSSASSFAQSGDMDAAMSSLEAARTSRDRLATTSAGHVESSRLPPRNADEIRLALRVLSRHFEVVRRAIEEPPIDAFDDALFVGADARWFRPPGGERVNLGRRRAARLLLGRLARQRVSAPDIAVSQDELFASGWPGHEIRPESASLRVRVALADLRKLGLRDVLLSRDDGYLLDPSVRIVIARRVTSGGNGELLDRGVEPGGNDANKT